MELAERYLGRGLIDIETFPRTEGVYKWRSILERKEQLAATLEADWFMHADADEVRLPPRSARTLAQTLAEALGMSERWAQNLRRNALLAARYAVTTPRNLTRVSRQERCDAVLVQEYEDP